MRLAAILSVIALVAACGGSDPGASNDYEVAALDVAPDDAGADAYAKCTLVIVPYGNCVHQCAQMFQHARDDFRYCKWKCGQECQ